MRILPGRNLFAPLMLAALFAVLVAIATKADAAPPASPSPSVQLDQQECAVMAIWGRDIVWARDMGADKKKVRGYLEDEAPQTPLFRVLLPMFDILWGTGAERTLVMQSLYRECVERRGRYGIDT